MSKALLYEIKKQIPYLAFVTISLIIINWLIFMDYKYVSTTDPSYATIPPLFIYAIYGVILVFMSIGYIFKMSKLHADLYFQVPLKREKLYLIHYLVGLIKIFIPITLAYWSTVLQIALNDNLYNMIVVIPYYFVLLLCFASTFTIFSFAYTRCTNPSDGALNMIFYTFILALLSGTIYFLFNIKGSFQGYIFEPITILTGKYLIYMQGEFEAFSSYEVITLIVWAIITIILGVLFFYLIKYDKTEDTMQISKTWFGPKTLIPVITTCSIILFVHDNFFYLPLIGLIITSYGIYALYAKNFKIGKKNAIILTVSIAIGLVIALIKSLI